MLHSWRRAAGKQRADSWNGCSGFAHRGLELAVIRQRLVVSGAEAASQSGTFSGTDDEPAWGSLSFQRWWYASDGRRLPSWHSHARRKLNSTRCSDRPSGARWTIRWQADRRVEEPTARKLFPALRQKTESRGRCGVDTFPLEPCPRSQASADLVSQHIGDIRSHCLGLASPGFITRRASACP